jgi:formamidopyrimidine-DNA glycosylase
MPELPEAETIARRLNEELSGTVLGKVTLTRKDIVHGDRRPLGKLVAGRMVESVTRRAKRVIIHLTPQAQLVFGLGMTGTLIICDIREPIEKHTHLRITFGKTKRELRFRDPRRFGGIWCITPDGKHAGRRLSEPGPEPLQLTPTRFREILARSRQIKALLMDQQSIAGLGNIYCDEALHAARIHPLAKSDALESQAAGRLLRAIKTTLKRAIRHNGSTLMNYRTATGETGSFQRYHRVYQRDDQPCRTCKTPIIRITAAGRSTFLCPSCQAQASG